MLSGLQVQSSSAVVPIVHYHPLLLAGTQQQTSVPPKSSTDTQAFRSLSHLPASAVHRSRL